MSSEKQIAANRKNSEKSTGPRTDAGKRKSRLNATKHGLYSELMPFLTPDENAPDLARLRRLYLEHFQPQTAWERHNVEKMALEEWRLNRYHRMEVELLGAYGFEPGEQDDVEPQYGGPGWGLAHDCSKGKSLLALSQVEDRVHRRFRAMQKAIRENPKPTATDPAVDLKNDETEASAS